MKKTVTNNQITKKLAHYSTMAGAIVLASGANAQILYTDVDPDETYDTNGDFYELDLNMDGDVDFLVTIYNFTYPSAFVTVTTGGLPGTQYLDATIRFVFANPYNGSIAGTSGVTTGGYSYARPYAFNAGANIDDGLSWHDLPQQSMVGYIGVLDFPAPGSTFNYLEWGDWSGKNDKYLPLRIVDGGDNFYGWARLDCDDNHHEFTIKDYAIQQTAETAIDAGQSVAIHNVIQNTELTAYSYNNTINVVVKDLQSAGGTVKVFNISGEVVYTNDLNMAGMTITLNNVATGNYTLQVVTKENGVYTKKLFINN